MKNNQGKITNIRTTYYLYENLHTRIRHTNNLCQNQ
jgi:hypothetical protein